MIDLDVRLARISAGKRCEDGLRWICDDREESED